MCLVLSKLGIIRKKRSVKTPQHTLWSDPSPAESGQAGGCSLLKSNNISLDVLDLDPDNFSHTSLQKQISLLMWLLELVVSVITVLPEYLIPEHLRSELLLVLCVEAELECRHDRTWWRLGGRWS